VGAESAGTHAQLVVCALAGAVMAWPGSCLAQVYPAKPIRIIVPTVPGGGGDTVARAIGLKLTDAWGQQVVVDNRTGIIGAELAAHAAPDGYTIMVTTASLTLRDAVYKKLPISTLRDFVPVTQVVAQALVLAAHPAVPAKSVRELVALAKSNPGMLNYGTGGNGSPSHLAGELFRTLADIKVLHVPYKGIPQALTDLLGGRLQYVFGTPESMMPLVNDGKLRLLGLTTLKRSPALPDVATIAESGVPGYEFSGWIGVLVPRGTSKDIVRKLNQEIVRIARLPDMKQKFELHASEVVGSTPEAFAAYLTSEIARWAKVARDANIRVE
jgi:tripartite-type tricarboxylate transporter receptor subunit TctC